MLALDFIKKSYQIASLDEFHSRLPLNDIFSCRNRDEDFLGNLSICNGELGTHIIRRRLLGPGHVSDLKVSGNMSDRVEIYNTLLGCGLFKGMAGEYLAIKSLTYRQSCLVPLLPHELFLSKISL